MGNEFTDCLLMSEWRLYSIDLDDMGDSECS